MSGDIFTEYLNAVSEAPVEEDLEQETKEVVETLSTIAPKTVQNRKNNAVFVKVVTPIIDGFYVMNNGELFQVTPLDGGKLSTYSLVDGRYKTLVRETDKGIILNGKVE